MRKKNAIGRPSVVNYTVMIKLADAIQHCASISDACRYAGISRDTFYRHYDKGSVFAEKINTAKNDQHMLVFSSLTTYQQIR